MTTQNNKVTSNINIENAKITFRNFKGEGRQYNPEGTRNFSVLLDDETAEQLKADGWRVRYLNPRDDEEPPQAHLPVGVSFNIYPPQIWMIAGGKKTALDQDTIMILDWAEIENVDLVIRPYNWSRPDGSSGVKAYLKAMYVTIVEDEFEKKYREVPGDGN